MSKQHSTVLGENLQKSYENSGIDINVEHFRYCCHNLWCESYNSSEPLTVDQIIYISKNIKELINLPYANTENAHLVASSIAKKNGWDEKQFNSWINGLDLCPTCHKALDRNGGNFTPDNEGKAYHAKFMERIAKSKLEINKYFGLKDVD